MTKWRERLIEPLRKLWERVRPWQKLALAILMIYLLTPVLLRWFVPLSTRITQSIAVDPKGEATATVLGVVVTVFALGVSVAMTIYTLDRASKREIEADNRELYQRFEFASIDLFRFEADHFRLIKPFWDKDTRAPSTKSAEFIPYKNYVCQMLNIFEMGISFFADKVVDEDIFGSWVAWFFEVSQAPGFPVVWPEVKTDYIGELGDVMGFGYDLHESRKDTADGLKLREKWKRKLKKALEDATVKFSDDKILWSKFDNIAGLGEDDREELFCQFVGVRFGSQKVLNWLKNQKEATRDD